MGSGKKKIEIKKITNEASRMVTFSKRRKGLFKKAQELSSKTGAKVAILVYSPTGRPYTYGDVSSAIAESFDGCSTSASTALHGSNNGGDHHVNGESTATCSNVKQWVENINVEACNNIDELMFLKQQLEETRENVAWMVNYMFAESLMKY